MSQQRGWRRANVAAGVSAGRVIDSPSSFGRHGYVFSVQSRAGGMSKYTCPCGRRWDVPSPKWLWRASDSPRASVLAHATQAMVARYEWSGTLNRYDTKFGRYGASKAGSTRPGRLVWADPSMATLPMISPGSTIDADCTPTSVTA